MAVKRTGNGSLPDQTGHASPLFRRALVPGVCAFTAVFGLGTQFYRWGLGGIPFPFEDAAMLFRYAEVLSQGGGLAWNHGDSPGDSDGATDLGFVLLLAPLMALGLKPATAAFLLNLLGLFGMGLLIGYVASRKLGSPWWIPVLVSFGMGLTVASPIAGGFSSPCMGFLLLLVLATSLDRVWQRNAEERKPIAPALFLGALAGLCGWWRPEGFALGPLVIALTYAVVRASGCKTPGKFWVRDLPLALVTYALVVLLWIFFRMRTFGQILQTSGVNKINEPDLNSALNAFEFYSVSLSWLLVPILVFLLALKKSHLALALGLVFVLSSLFWLPFALTFNWWGRIFWPMVPILAVWALTLVLAAGRSLIAGVQQKSNASVIVVATTMLLLVPLVPLHGGRYAPSPFHTSMYQALRPLDTDNVKIATTEAGLIPLAIKRGRALDTYLHNTRSIAEGGDAALRRELASFDPNMVVVHGPPPFMSDSRSECLDYYGERWFLQTQTLYEYVKRANMKLIRSDVAGPCDTWNVFSDESVSQSIVSEVRKFPPIWG